MIAGDTDIEHDAGEQKGHAQRSPQPAGEAEAEDADRRGENHEAEAHRQRGGEFPLLISFAEFEPNDQIRQNGGVETAERQPARPTPPNIEDDLPF